MWFGVSKLPGRRNSVGSQTLKVEAANSEHTAGIQGGRRRSDTEPAKLSRLLFELTSASPFAEGAIKVLIRFLRLIIVIIIIVIIITSHERPRLSRLYEADETRHKARWNYLNSVQSELESERTRGQASEQKLLAIRANLLNT